MDKITLSKIGGLASELVIMCGEYEGLYGTNNPTINSPSEAWTLYEGMMQTQRSIAALLDEASISYLGNKGREVSMQGWTNFDGKSTKVQAATDLFKAIGGVSYCLAQINKLTNVSQEIHQRLLLENQHRIARILSPEAVRNRHQGTK